MTTPDGPSADLDHDRTVPSHGPIWVGAFVLLVVASNAATILTSRLVDSNPGALLALSSRNRNLVLTAPGMEFWPWVALGAGRLALSATVCHLLGRAYGDQALRWFWRFLGMPVDQVTKFESGFAKAEWVVVPFFVGSNIVWVLTGAARTTWKRLVPLAAVGLVGRLLLLWWLAQQFRDEVNRVVDFLTDYQWHFIIGAIVVVALTQMRNLRGSR